MSDIIDIEKFSINKNGIIYNITQDSKPITNFEIKSKGKTYVIKAEEPPIPPSPYREETDEYVKYIFNPNEPFPWVRNFIGDNTFIIEEFEKQQDGYIKILARYSTGENAYSIIKSVNTVGDYENFIGKTWDYKYLDYSMSISIIRIQNNMVAGVIVQRDLEDKGGAISYPTYLFDNSVKDLITADFEKFINKEYLYFKFDEDINLYFYKV